MSLLSSIKIIKIKLKFKKKSLKNTEKDLLELLSNKKYDFSSFKNIELTGRGSFGTVFRANRKNKNFALKTFNNNKMTLVVKELKIHKLVNHHENILRFCGITEINAENLDDQRDKSVSKKGQEVACESISNNKEEMNVNYKTRRLLEII
ncbi:14293_t:CDS:2 [Rhizophagus irregularis]|nr:14293_t:CDS:2 [Rhizophagus irregularis]